MFQGMPKRRVIVAFLAFVSLASGLFLLANAEAQNELLGFPIIYVGKVTAGGTPVPDNLAITARMGDKEFSPVYTSNGEYPGLTVNGPSSDNGKQVTFWLQGVVKADQADAFTYQAGPRGVKTLNLTFSHVPEPTPTPTATPTITPTPLPLGPLKVGLRAPGAESVRMGDEFTVEVAISPEGHRVLRGEVAVAFDPRVVKLLGTTAGPLLPRAVFAATVGESVVQGAFFQVDPSPPLRAAGALVVLRFKARQDAKTTSTEISLLRVSVVDHLNQPFPLDLQKVSLGIALQGTPGDINRDGKVNVMDLAYLGAAYGTRVGDSTYNAAADLNEDGAIGPGDLEVLAANYGRGT